ncbi:MAG: bifunctional oligoribonuclease/PAP phosphatase NrnA [Ignavibacteria bacterium CG_4_8_14_3_um_filter_37_9]|nr:bifunctional oligoribonuclease/PAP phosphatase NrnA [Ignavibacteria bacterium]OIO13986.1 MAG: exopolyphosphatase [Ignavibacteria bacterium CG1_02_37_35]PIW99488.1 MAG: bifunctional oligoribonuclease/PAP phosphatase NrnA [Ignavibacteria bacterium CG_4_8_14_3_um_filter_37_9]PIX94236.1 MAG: bifunctional oligoribonuclease/PAP phosphatase NrnA [Ignavibacteria bacterium CG_4_10_14_3_um_filter_37_18]PJC60494.1 MAG: bifunctional oligoribonuclease/PAP phosphatase NrnA [Ignavibacteria bacterium CG_4_9
MNYKLLKQIIQENNSFLLTTHVNPDADAIGSEMAFYFLLKKLGKEIHIINTSKTPYYLEFMDAANVIQYFDEEKHNDIFNQVDVLIALDFNRGQRMVRLENLFRQSAKLKICIDHHEDPEEFTDYLFSETSFAATGQIIYNFIKATSLVEIDLSIAEPLYAAIMTDTGSFRFDRTTADIHYIAADLLNAGVKPNDVYTNIYNTSRIGKVKLLGDALQSLKLYGDKNEIAVMTISNEAMKKSGADEADTDGFVNLCLTIDTVQVALKFLELNEGFKVSLRSKGEISVQKIAAEFGGGGHRNASGIRIREKNMNTFIPVLIEKVNVFLNSLDQNKKS